MPPLSTPRPARVEEAPTQGTQGGLRGLGTSPAMRRAQKLVEQSAASEVPVLITGEVGVGKELVAREIHRRSSRGAKALLEINCASLPNDFFDSSALGRQASSLDAVDPSTRTKLEAMAGGTLFLDDLGELTPALQDRLLQLLRQRDAGRIASEDRPLVDFRLIAATHRDLTKAMEAGTFCEELYYRVNLIHIHVPPLREHPEDIPALLQGFMHEHKKREGWQGEIPDAMLARFRSYEWPGNIRELENAVRRLIALQDPAYVLEEIEARSESGAPPRISEFPSNGKAHALPITVRPAAPNASGSSRSSFPPQNGGHSVDLKELGRRASDVAEREAILDMLMQTLGSKKAAAQRLGISYKALLYKIRDFGIAGARANASCQEPADDTSPTRP